jgi:phosphonate transport system substrate-binding protein
MTLITSDNTLYVTSCQAPNAEATVLDILRFISEQLNMPIEFDRADSWRERFVRLDAGKLHAAWICGMPYIQRADQDDPLIELLVAPVMRGERYQDRPVYFSDVMVRHNSPYQTFADLKGVRWSYNDRGSHSGHNVVRWYLATHNLDGDFFGSVVGSGGHQRSLQMLLNNEIDASALDSTVLETELRRDPSLAERIRRIEIIGPSPIPPWVVNRHLAPDLRDRLRRAFLTMHEDSRGQDILAAGDYARFTAVTDQDYDPVREMARLALRAYL